MVILFNTGDSTSQNVLDLYRHYQPIKGKPKYGPRGHEGINFLEFEASQKGYSMALKLDRKFKSQRRGLEEWKESRPRSQTSRIKNEGHFKEEISRDTKPHYPVIFGHLAEPEDMMNLDPDGKFVKWEVVEYSTIMENIEQKLKQVSSTYFFRV